jgi:hypothetical protein
MQLTKKELTQPNGPGSATVPVAVARVSGGTSLGAGGVRRNASRHGRPLCRGMGGQARNPSDL